MAQLHRQQQPYPARCPFRRGCRLRLEPPPAQAHRHFFEHAAPGLIAALISFLALPSAGLFLATIGGVCSALWPLQLLNPAWQLRLAGSLVNGAPFALLGLALLQQSRSSTSAQSSRISGAERRLVALRQAVAGATCNEEINQRMQRLQGPVLGPADIAQPLPLLKAQVAAVLDQAAQQIARERQATPPADPWRLLPQLLRNGIACLALALGFAALAVRPGAEVSLLQEWQGGWSGLSRSLRKRRGSRGSTASSSGVLPPDPGGGAGVTVWAAAAIGVTRAKNRVNGLRLISGDDDS